jgi:hypothetical protein
MHVPLRDCHVPVPGKMGQRPGVHVRRPAGQACVSQRVQRERFHCPLAFLVSRTAARLHVLLCER